MSICSFASTMVFFIPRCKASLISPTFVQSFSLYLLCIEFSDSWIQRPQPRWFTTMVIDVVLLFSLYLISGFRDLDSLCLTYGFGDLDLIFLACACFRFWFQMYLISVNRNFEWVWWIWFEISLDLLFVLLWDFKCDSFFSIFTDFSFFSRKNNIYIYIYILKLYIKQHHKITYFDMHHLSLLLVNYIMLSFKGMQNRCNQWGSY